MENLQAFDYDQPSRATLARIYLEVSDATAEGAAAGANTASGEAVLPTQRERLVGITVTVDDGQRAERPGQTPPAG
jgi:hypothetical protein